jgi:hypothetical protein
MPHDSASAGTESPSTWNVKPGEKPGTLLVCFGTHERRDGCTWIEYTLARDVTARHEHTIEQGEAGARDMARVAGAYYRELIAGALDPERASQLTASFVMLLIAQNQTQQQLREQSRRDNEHKG